MVDRQLPINLWFLTCIYAADSQKPELTLTDGQMTGDETKCHDSSSADSQAELKINDFSMFFKQVNAN